jgi:hypothetical protein
MLLWLFSADDLQHGPTLSDKSIGDQRPMASPGDSFCAHDRGMALFGKVD